MKKSILTFLAFASIIIGVIFLMSFKPSEGTDDMILVRTYETSTFFTSKIIISDGIKIVKSVELEATKPKSMEGNALKIAAELRNVKNQGYTLTSSNSGGSSEVFTITNYVFEKK